MAVVVKEIKELKVGETVYDLGKTTPRIPAGTKVSVHLFFSVGADINPRRVFVALWNGSNILAEQQVGEANPFWPWKDIDDWYNFIISETIPASSYWIVARTEEEVGYNTGLGKQIIVTPKLIPGYAQLNIDSLPTGATVYVNGEQKGITPITLQVPEGTYDIKVEKKDYKVKDITGSMGSKVDEETWRVVARAGDVVEVTFILEPSAALWKSAWFWGLAGIGLGAMIAFRKKPEYAKAVRERAPEYARAIRERAPEYLGRAKEVAGKLVGAVRR